MVITVGRKRSFGLRRHVIRREPRRFGGNISSTLLQLVLVSFLADFHALKVEAVCSSRTWDFLQTKRCYNSEDHRFSLRHFFFKHLKIMRNNSHSFVTRRYQSPQTRLIKFAFLWSVVCDGRRLSRGPTTVQNSLLKCIERSLLQRT